MCLLEFKPQILAVSYYLDRLPQQLILKLKMLGENVIQHLPFQSKLQIQAIPQQSFQVLDDFSVSFALPCYTLNQTSAEYIYKAKAHHVNTMYIFNQKFGNR